MGANKAPVIGSGLMVVAPSDLTPADLGVIPEVSNFRRNSPIGIIGSIIFDNFTISESETVIGGGSQAVVDGMLNIAVPATEVRTMFLDDGAAPAPYSTAFFTIDALSLGTGAIGTGWLFTGERAGILAIISGTSPNHLLSLYVSDEGGGLTFQGDENVTLTAPFSLAVELKGLYVNIWTQSGEFDPDVIDGWNLVIKYKLTEFDGRLKTKFPNLLPAIDMYGGDSGSTATVSIRGSTLSGEVGWREPMPVNNMDGSYYTAGGKYYVSLDAAGANTETGGVNGGAAVPLYLSVWEYNPVSKELVTEVAKIFMDDGTRVYGVEDGFICYDEGTWRMYWGDWAVTDEAVYDGVVRLFCSSTVVNLLSGVHVLLEDDSVEVTTPVELIYPYDPMVMKRGSQYFLGGTFLTGPWNQIGTQSYGFLAVGDSPTNFPTSRGTTEPTNGEGCSLLKLDGKLYQMMSRRTDGVQLAYDENMNFLSEIGTPVVNPGNIPSQCRHIGFYTGGTIEHQFIDFLYQEEDFGNAACGPIIISVSPVVSTGWDPSDWA